MLVQVSVAYIFFLFSPEKWALTLHANYLSFWMQFAGNVKAYFRGKIEKYLFVCLYNYSSSIFRPEAFIKKKTFTFTEIKFWNYCLSTTMTTSPCLSHHDVMMSLNDVATGVIPRHCCPVLPTCHWNNTAVLHIRSTWSNRGQLSNSNSFS